MEFTDKIIQGDCLTVLPTMPEKSVHCVITSPPYYALRTYTGITPTSWPDVTYSIFGFPVTIPAMTCELGHESNPKQYIGHMLLIFREIKRVLRDDGTLWLNIGDSYVANGKDRTEKQAVEKSTLQGGKKTQIATLRQQNKITEGLKPKDMIGIPWMLAYALRDDGWYLRADIVWSKPNPMPESVTDRPTKSHEYFFLLAKSQRYYYDAEAIKTEPKYPGVKKYKYAWGRAIDGSLTDNRKGHGEDIRKMKSLENGQANIRKFRDKQRGHSRRHNGFNDRGDQMSHDEQMSMGANKRSVWEIPTYSFPDAHFATFPEDLVVDPIKAGTSEFGCCSECGAPYSRVVKKELVPTPKAAKTFIVDERDHQADPGSQGHNRQKDGHKSGYINQSKTTGWVAGCKCDAEVVPCAVLDPFSGAGTTFLVAKKLNRHAIGIEMSQEYVKMSEKRIKKELGMFSPV